MGSPTNRARACKGLLWQACAIPIVDGRPSYSHAVATPLNNHLTGPS